jgi:VWFA-related protein
MSRASRPVRPSAALLAVLLAALPACQRKNNPLLSPKPAGVTSANLFIPQIETLDAPNEKIFVAVVDGSGTPRTDFKLGNFTILEGGAPGVPYEVGRVSDPLSIALVIDRSGSMSGSRTTAANNAAVALVNAMSGTDAMALIEFESEIRQISDFTTDKSRLTALINAGVASGGTALYDAVGAGAGTLNGRRGRKLLLVLTDGDDTASKGSLDDAVRGVNGKGLSAYPVGLGDSFNAAALQQIADSTGASFLSSSTGSDLSSVFLSVLNRFNNLIYISYRRRSEGQLTVFLNYGDVTAKATKNF